MEYLGIAYSIHNPPRLDPGFIPFGVWREAYLAAAARPVSMAAASLPEV